MKNSLPEPNVIRQYLLGRFDEQDERESALSEQILFNDDLAELVESLEDEIIEEYLDGNLDPSDRKAVEGYFLRSPERKTKLRFARLLRGYFDTKQSDLVDPVVAHWATRFRPYWSHAALILLAIVSLTYIFRISRTESSLEAQLVQKREISANLAPSAQQVQPAVAVLTLATDRTRGIGTSLQRTEITRSTQRLIVEIVLSSAASVPYDVQLSSHETNKVIWSARLLPLVSPDGARLLFDVPDEHIKSGTYSFAVSLANTPTTRPQNFDFQVTVTR